MADDIVERLRNGADDAGWSCDFSDEIDLIEEAAAEIERLREQLEFAHNILGSETMVWLFHGSDGWKQSNISNLRDPIHAYWEKYGNLFKEARRG